MDREKKIVQTPSMVADTTAERDKREVDITIVQRKMEEASTMIKLSRDEQARAGKKLMGAVISKTKGIIPPADDGSAESQASLDQAIAYVADVPHEDLLIYLAGQISELRGLLADSSFMSGIANPTERSERKILENVRLAKYSALRNGLIARDVQKAQNLSELGGLLSK